jgi:hypothetical protein
MNRIDWATVAIAISHGENSWNAASAKEAALPLIGEGLTMSKPPASFHS